jgi:hypothetical protein
MEIVPAVEIVPAAPAYTTPWAPLREQRPLSQAGKGGLRRAGPLHRRGLRWGAQTRRNLQAQGRRAGQSLARGQHLLGPARPRQRKRLARSIAACLQLRLRVQADSPRRRRVRPAVFKGRGGPVTGVNPRSNKALAEALGGDA